ncbi:RNA-binding domain-containing protein [Actinotignum schaalii]|uniref:RNA-binding domain-containing protein n=1 Tax=Actinotignum schaalii TaxID=59505 RepID=UPI00373F806E
MVDLGNESETLEFKKTTSELKEACVSIAAMLNKHGLGTVLFGVKPDGTAIGQDVSEATLRSISRTIAESIKPQVYPTITTEVLDGVSVVKVEVNGNDIPYSVRGRYYLRTADEDRPVTPAALRDFFVKASSIVSWEAADSGVSVDQLDKEVFGRFVRDGLRAGRLPEFEESSERVLDRLGLTVNGNLNNAGNLLFGSGSPVSLKLAVFATPEKLTFLDIKHADSNIYRLLETAEKYVLANIRWRSEIFSGSREEVPEIPAPAVREIIANSFAHADYRARGVFHEVCVYSDRITVFSPGSFANQHSPEGYIDGVLPSLPRNPLIAKTLYLGRKIEQFGSGLKRVASLCDDVDVPYEFTNLDVGFMVALMRGTDDRNGTGIAIDVTLNSTEMAVLALLTQSPQQTRQELAEKISKTARTVQRALNTLAMKGYIRREGSKANPKWRVL